MLEQLWLAGRARTLRGLGRELGGHREGSGGAGQHQDLWNRTTQSFGLQGPDLSSHPLSRAFTIPGLWAVKTQKEPQQNTNFSGFSASLIIK